MRRTLIPFSVRRASFFFFFCITKEKTSFSLSLVPLLLPQPSQVPGAGRRTALRRGVVVDGEEAEGEFFFTQRRQSRAPALGPSARPSPPAPPRRPRSRTSPPRTRLRPWTSRKLSKGRGRPGRRAEGIGARSSSTWPCRRRTATTA